ncbi:hypothetical protein Clacol_002318 [Clathrus columnatus]|uniref:FAD-dependent urate hydroxylase HpyO/Asp monooxygenase CreE-like FAD/NAD(P)-binding domain-containing protein n=1 Tax=Clathrus columnatus TaxID=1419009 RepID=A0AAV5A876_9AGAM|nr:hypothetical protein Clacol_002318 [Clathrus columnatus]
MANMDPMSAFQMLPVNKSIAIVGAGSAGLAMLKTLTELPDETKRSLNFVLFEEREDVGGIWFPDTSIVHPPELPETPLYPRLRTNTPVPTMTYPNITFPPVMEAKWLGTPYAGQWNLTILNSNGINETKVVDHLVVATGNNHIPHSPSWLGQDSWLRQSADHEILHSIYYRGPERYTNKTVLIVGGGASGGDISGQIYEVAQKVYVSLRHPSSLGIPPEVEIRPDISHFTNNTVVFVDNSQVEVDFVLLATGYQLRKPFLEAGDVMTIHPKRRFHRSNKDDDNDDVVTSSQTLTTNFKYIFPLHKHILSLCNSYPPTALSFIGLLRGTPICPSDYAQSLFVTHVILHPDILPSRDEMLNELELQEQKIREQGLDPYKIGHQLFNETTNDYQDDLVDFLRDKGVISSWTPKFVEQWRRDAKYPYLRRGWIHIEDLGEAEQWLKGVETEAEWADLMDRVNAWQHDWENKNNIPFVPDLLQFDYVDNY